MAIDFLILYEHVVREYDCILLLKAELEKRGYTVEVRQLLDRKKLRYFTVKKPKVIVTSCMYNNESINSHVYNNVGRLDKVVNLHWEQILSREQEQSPWFNCLENARFAVQTCWGEATKNRLLSEGVPSESLEITGALQLDFLRPEFSGFFEDRATLCERFGIDSDKKLILYISSFGYANMDDKEVEELSNMAGLDFRGFRDTNKRSMDSTLDWFCTALEKQDDISIVYRPHPSEWKCARLVEMQEQYKNFHVVSDYTVKQWVVVSDRVYNWMSTALAEVYFAGKGCGIIRPCPIESEYDPVIYETAQFIDTEEKLLCDLQSNTEIYPFDEDYLKSFYSVTDRPAYKRMSDLLERVLQQPARGKVFGEGYKPKFNLLKYCALVGVHIFHAFRFNPTKLKKIAPSFAAFAGRIYGYIDKAYVKPSEAKKRQRHIEKFMK